MDPMQPLPPSVRRLWQMVALSTGIGLVVALAAIELAVRRQVDDVPGPALLVPVTAGAVVGGLAFTWAGLAYRAWRFELTDAWVRASWGVVQHYTATVPRNRVQTLTSHNGPLDRLLGLTTITIHTAGAGSPNVSIPHLEDTTVEWLRGELARAPVE